MALFNHLFPYSNFHDINLDWIISIIKSIDPAVIQALQELTPDIIEQVNQKVAEAQAFAVSAQSSASEANTARENAATSAVEAAQDATEAAADAARAESAKTEVENSLIPVDLSSNVTVVGNGSLYNAVVFLFGKTGWIQIFGELKDANAYYKINFPESVSLHYNRILAHIPERGWTSPEVQTDGKISLGTFFGSGVLFGMIQL